MPANRNPTLDLGELSEKNTGLADLSLREIAVFAPLLVWAFWIGLYPKTFFQVMERSVAQIVERVEPGYYEAHKIPNPLARNDAARLAH